MSANQIISEYFMQFCCMMNNLPEEEREYFRDQLLAFLLFGEIKETTAYDKDKFAGLNEQEKELIWKLAKQTEQLNRLLRDQNKEDYQ